MCGLSSQQVMFSLLPAYLRREGMNMRLVVFGGDRRIQGALMRARGAGWETLHICGEEDVPKEMSGADAVLLPWPHSFREEKLVGGALDKERVLALIPPCRLIVHGSGVEAAEMPQADAWMNPGTDEAFQRVNARLTAEGAIYRAMQRPERAILGDTVMVTGFGRIGQELTARLAALGAFVIVCARSEMQMRHAHDMGAHPVPLSQAASACRQADVIFNTVPAHVLGKGALEKIRKDALVIELASPPYGMNMELAKHMGIAVVIEGGLPGRYAPLDAGAALFDALLRALERTRGERKGGDSDG